MFGLLFILLIVVPLAELYVIVQVAQGIGILPTLALLIAVSVFGAYLLKREGVAAWRRLQRALAQGQMPAAEISDGAMILFGGALLLTPGFITDAVGALFLLPGSRGMLKGLFRKAIKGFVLGRVSRGARLSYKVYETTANRRRRPTSDQRSEDPPAPRPQLPPDDPGSPGTG